MWFITTVPAGNWVPRAEQVVLHGAMHFLGETLPATKGMNTFVYHAMTSLSDRNPLQLSTPSWKPDPVIVWFMVALSQAPREELYCTRSFFPLCP